MSATRSTGKLKHIPPRRIKRNPENPRLIFRQDEMESLMVSIDTHGIQVPLTVYSEGNDYLLIDGERRWRCACKLNLRTVPALVQDKPTELQNLLLMYNIHALREQWDYFTIATKLTRVIKLFTIEHSYKPNEIQLSEATGLTRGQIRRCQLLLNLPDRFQGMLLKELELPKSQQKISEDLFIEMERSLKTLVRRLPEYDDVLEDIRDTLIKKFRVGTIPAVTDFRQLSKIVTAMENLNINHTTTMRTLDNIFDAQNDTGIREAYEGTVEFGYDKQKASSRVQSLTEYLDDIMDSGQEASLDETFLTEVRKLYTLLRKLLRKD